MEPQAPQIFPSSGYYKPPISVSLSSDLANGETIMYTVESTNLNQAENRAEKYVAPFLLSNPGRFRVSAHVWRPGFGEGPSSTAIYMLEETSTMQPTLLSGSVLSNPSMVSSRPHPVSSDPVYRLIFTKLPTVLRSLQQFDVEMCLVDQAGFQVAATFSHPTNVVLCAEILDGAQTSQILVPLDKIPDSKVHQQPPFVETGMMLITSEKNVNGTSCGLSKAGRGTSWNSFANTAPCISATNSSFNGLSFQVSCIARAIVGFHTGIEDPASEIAWRMMTHSFHFSADLGDANTVPAFRIYELGRLVEEAGTTEFLVGDKFSLQVRPNGDVAYFHNDRLVYTCINSDVLALTSVYSVMVRIAAQQESTAISSLSLITPGEPFVARVEDLLWRPPIEVDQSQPQRIVLRAFISGTDYLPATATIPLVTNSIPRWSIAALSLTSMFALGALGCQGNHVSTMMTTFHERHFGLLRSPIVRRQVEVRDGGEHNPRTTLWTSPMKVSMSTETAPPQPRAVFRF